MAQQVDQSGSRTLRLHDAGETLPPGLRSGPDPDRRRKPSTRRSDEERERRHRERAIAAWLRDLSR